MVRWTIKTHLMEMVCWRIKNTSHGNGPLDKKRVHGNGPLDNKKRISRKWSVGQ